MSIDDPVGTLRIVYFPSSLVVAERELPITRTRVSGSGAFASLVIRPVMVPCAWAARVNARDSGTTTPATARNLNRARNMFSTSGGNAPNDANPLASVAGAQARLE